MYINKILFFNFYFAKSSKLVQTSKLKQCLANWAAQSNFVLLQNFNNVPDFSGCWLTGINPNLAFANNGYESWSLDRRVLEKYPSSLNQSFLITASKFVASVQAVKLLQSQLGTVSFINDKPAKDLPSPDSGCVDEAYQNFYYSILQAAKTSIPFGCKNND